VNSAEPAWVDEVLRFWFDEVAPTKWFNQDDAVDAQIRARFLALHDRLTSQDGIDGGGPRPSLAAIIVLDQFSRNLFRGSSRAYSADAVARRLSKDALARGFDLGMSKEARYFLYLPFEHSEDRDDQALSVNLIGALGNEDWTQHAMEHKATIDRFGRFPHRNAALNRLSTAAEIAQLRLPSSSWQSPSTS
jgi:uncharacterized protein (DUF924 family)